MIINLHICRTSSFVVFSIWISTFLYIKIPILIRLQFTLLIFITVHVHTDVIEMNDKYCVSVVTSRSKKKTLSFINRMLLTGTVFPNAFHDTFSYKTTLNHLFLLVITCLEFDWYIALLTLFNMLNKAVMVSRNWYISCELPRYF